MNVLEIAKAEDVRSEDWVLVRNSGGNRIYEKVLAVYENVMIGNRKHDIILENKNGMGLYLFKDDRVSVIRWETTN